ncbi:MAG: hypothetical protein KC502_21795, partial [Myxococcales bacterium]|nr:hypothetical protein [Myxococcales bacterium]
MDGVMTGGGASHCPQTAGRGKRCKHKGVQIRGLVALVALAMVTATSVDGHSRTRSKRKRTEGMLLAIEAAEYVIDLGRRDGLTPGTRLQLYRTIRIAHPVTGKKVRDRFSIGFATVSEVSERMAVLQPLTSQKGRLRVGDPVVIARIAKPESVARRATRPSTSHNSTPRRKTTPGQSGDDIDRLMAKAKAARQARKWGAPPPATA